MSCDPQARLENIKLTNKIERMESLLKAKVNHKLFANSTSYTVWWVSPYN